MASAKFLEEALSTDVDDSVVSDIVGSLENLESSSSSSLPTSSQNKIGYQPVSAAISGSNNSPKPVAIHPLVLKPGGNNQVTVQNTVNVTRIIVCGSNVVTNTKPITQQTVSSSASVTNSGQSMLPNVQFVNVRQGAPLAIQKTMANVSPRVVLGGPQAVAARAASPALTLQSLPGLQTGQPGAHLLLKTESGQYQLLRVGPAPGGQAIPTQPGQTIRMSTIQSPQGISTVSTSVATVNPQPISNIIPPQMATVHTAAGGAQQSAPIVTTTKSSDNTKEKCRNFLANLLDLSCKEPETVERNVRNLIQELIDDRVQPEGFCDRLERQLNASPQPCLIGFLQKSLPLLRQSMVTKELSIDGIQPPPLHAAYPGTQFPTPPTIQASQPQVIHQPKPMVLPTLPRPQVMQPAKPTISVLQNIPVQVSKMVTKQSKMGASTTFTSGGKSAFVKSGMGAQQININSPLPKPLPKEKKTNMAGSFATPFVDIDKMVADDDINDVAAMGGVNLAEESQRILGSTEMIGTQIRSIRDEVMVPGNVMAVRLMHNVRRHNLDEPGPELSALFSHALQEYLKNLIEKLSIIAEHRADPLKIEPNYVPTQDIKAQLKFMEDVDKVERKKREETEREQLLRAAKSRSKTEDPEQAKLKAKAKEMQRTEMEELRQREANLTALLAIGPRKKAKTDMPGDTTTPSTSSTGLPSTVKPIAPVRSRMKRANLRQLTFLLENEKTGSHSRTVYINYLK